MQETKTVWHLCSNRWNSAITEYALSCAQAFRHASWSSFLSPLSGSACEARAKDLGLAARSFRFGFGDLPSLRQELQRIRPDLIITYGGPETFLGRFLWGVPCLRFRGQDSDLSEPLPPRRTRLNLSHCKGVLVPAEGLAERFREVLPHKAVLSIPLGIDAHRFRFFAEEVPASRPKLLVVGRLDPIKGHAHLFAIYKSMLAIWNGPPPLLEVIGQAANISVPQLREFAEKAGLREGEDWQLISERVPDLPERMARAHLGLIPSLGSEVICRVAEEFLLCGTPVFVSGVGSLEECLKREDFGQSYRGQKAPEILLKDWLLRAWQESSLDKKTRAEGARAYFSLETMGEELDRQLRSLIF